MVFGVPRWWRWAFAVFALFGCQSEASDGDVPPDDLEVYSLCVEVQAYRRGCDDPPLPACPFVGPSVDCRLARWEYYTCIDELFCIESIELCPTENVERFCPDS